VVEVVGDRLTDLDDGDLRKKEAGARWRLGQDRASIKMEWDVTTPDNDPERQQSKETKT